jgi:hypothetical protein
MSSQNNLKDIPPIEHQDSLPPTNIGRGHPEYHFVQSILELQKTIVETKVAVESINISIGTLKDDVKSIKTKVEDLVSWRNKILGGALTLGFLLTFGFGVAKLLDGVPINFGVKNVSPAEVLLPTAPPK